MRRIYLAVGVMVVSGVGATYALQEATRHVMGPGIEKGTNEVEALAATQIVPEPVDEYESDVELSAGDQAELDSWYAEEAEPDSEPEFNEDESANEQRSEYDERENVEPEQVEPAE